MAPVAISARWRWFSLVFGVLVPVLVWGWLASAAASSTMPVHVRGTWHLALVVVEIGALLAWSFLRRRTPALELAFAVLFACGAVLAGFYCLLCLVGLAWTFSDVQAREPAWWLMLLSFLSPFPCLVAYAGSASVALWNWHTLPRADGRAA